MSEVNDSELWLPVPGHEGLYSVSSHGRVRSEPRPIPATGRYGCPRRTVLMMKLKPRRAKNGDPNRGWGQYPVVSLRRGGNARTWFVHRLVAMAFVGPQPAPGYEVNHKNGIKDDNRPENLEWMTPADNIRHAVATGLRVAPKGAEHWNTRITTDDVLEIKKAHKKLINDLATRFGVCVTHIHNIIKGHRAAHLLPKAETQEAAA